MKDEIDEMPELKRVEGKTRGACTARNIILIILCVMAKTYVLLYCMRFAQLNFGGKYKRVLAHEWEPQFWERLICYTPEQDYEAGVLWLDLNGDGKDEVITNGGPYLMGASQYYYYVFEHPSEGQFKYIGGWYVSDFDFYIPPWTIWGWPAVWLPDRDYKWVPWKEEKYNPKDLLG